MKSVSYKYGKQLAMTGKEFTVPEDMNYIDVKRGYLAGVRQCLKDGVEWENKSFKQFVEIVEKSDRYVYRFQTD